jgi:hypothetical protein
MHEGHAPILPGRRKCRERRVHAEKAIQVDCPQVHARLAVVGPRDGQRRAQTIILGLAMRHDDIQYIGCTAQKDADQHIAARRGMFGRERHARYPGRPCERREAQRGCT